MNGHAPAPRREGAGDLGGIGDVARKLATPTAKRRARAADLLDEAWTLVAGPGLAEATHVRSFREGVVTVTTASAPLCHELASFRREGLLVALNERLAASRGPAVTAIMFRVGVR